MSTDEIAPDETCNNCGTPRTGRYCAGCGQDLRHARLQLVPALRDALDTSIGLEGRLFRTVIGLFQSPGTVARDYLDGKRARYTHPIRYAIGTCALWWGVMAIVLAQIPSEQWNQLPEGYRLLLRNGNWLNLLLVPLIALPVSLAFFGLKRSWLEHFYALLFFAGQTFLWRAGLGAIGSILPEDMPLLTQIIVVGDQLAAILYLAWGWFVLHRESERWWLLLFVRIPLAGASAVLVTMMVTDYVKQLLAG